VAAGRRRTDVPDALWSAPLPEGLSEHPTAPGRRSGGRPAGAPMSRAPESPVQVARPRLPLPPVPAGPRAQAPARSAVPPRPEAGDRPVRIPPPAAPPMLSQPVRTWADEDALVSTGPGFAAGGARPSAPVPRLPRTPVPTGPASPAYGDWTKPSRDSDPEISQFSGPIGPLDMPQAPLTTAIPDREVHSRAADTGAGRAAAGRAAGGRAAGGRAAERAERQAADAARRKAAKRKGEPDPLAHLDPDEPATRRAPRRIVLSLVAMTVVALGVLGVYSFTSPDTEDAGSTSAADTSTATDSSDFAAPTSVLPPLDAEPLTVDASPATPVRVPVTVLNSTQINGLAARVAETINATDWEAPTTGAYTGGDVAASTVFFTEGDENQRQAAVQLIEAFPQLQGPSPRFFELPADIPAPGLVVVLTGDWQP
jgi:hypothetical protein